MYYMQKSNVIYRNYGSFGYITDNRNFGYKYLNDTSKVIGDKILSESGNVFFSALSRIPKSLDEIVIKISEQYSNVLIDRLKEDAHIFFEGLESDGFVVSGETILECTEKDILFSYNNLSTSTQSNHNPNTNETGKDTQDFFQEYFGDKPQMTHLHIEITGQCNERCVHCYIPHEKKTICMDANLFYDILEQCREMNLLNITISGGEPMLHSNFIDFISKCNEYNFSVNVLSNLTLMDQDVIDEMKCNPLLGIQTSLYSMNPDVHDEITQMPGSFEKTLSSILKLIKNGIPLQVSCPIMKQNRHDYKDVISWCNDHQLHANSDYVIIGNYDHTMHNLNCRLSLDNIHEIMCDNINNDSKYFESITKEYEQKKSLSPDDHICSVCQSSICISESGNVYPCSGWQGYVIGNINKSTLSEIWQSSEEIKHLRNIRRHDFPKCCDCPDRRFCTMCMVRNANESVQGNPFEVNEFFCNISELKRKIYLKKVSETTKTKNI